jgi:asparagine synthase (glutamine-hydrolysing)
MYILYTVEIRHPNLSGQTMPGLFGYADQSDTSRDDLTLRKMRDLLIYRKEHKSEPFFHKEGVHAGYCAPSFESVDECVAEESGVTCWFDGEFYNTRELSGEKSSGMTGRSVKELIIGAYKTGTLKEFLRKTDGYFSAVIYDYGKRRLTLAIDRFGFRHIFYTKYEKKFLWASECKAFLAMPDFKIDVNRQSVDEFMRLGILCEDRTWLNGVYLLNPATILTYDTETGSIRTETYWSPSEIRPVAAKIDIREDCEEWGRLFKLSVARRIGEKERVGLTLSGGLDSRAILAAMPVPGSEINAVTLGDGGCDDVRFAAMAAKIKGAEHHFFPLKVDGWFERACLGVWATDGALNLSSQLGIEHLSAFSKLFESNMIGMGGGVMQGGMEPGTSVYDAYGKTEDAVAGLNMRNRRMIRCGFRLDESFFKIRMPYYDSDLYDFVMAVPQDIRKKGLLINRALLHNFPRYYKRIPWQKTGVPISLPPPLFNAGYFYNRLLSRFKRKLHGIGLPVHDSKLYFNLSETFNSDGNRKQREKMLSYEEAFYPRYLPKDFTIFSLNKHMDVKIEKICRILTFEIYMRQLNDPAFRPGQCSADNAAGLT